jgi:hypothetical protein
MRRNLEYREGYAKLQGMQPSDAHFQVLVKEMCDQFQTLRLINPYREFDELSQAEKMWLNPSSAEVRCFHPFEVFSNPGRTLLDKPGIGIEDIIDDKSMNLMFLRIDFSKIRSIKTLKRSIGTLVESRHEMYQKFDKDAVTKNTRMREQYERILQVGDMRMAGLTNDEIADKIFPQDTSPDSAKQKASNDFQRYKELVNGGYKNFIA